MIRSTVDPQGQNSHSKSRYSQSSRYLVNNILITLKSSFDQGLIMMMQGKIRKVKSQKLLFWAFTKYSYFIRKIPTKARFKGNSFLYPMVQESDLIGQWFKGYGFIHYRCFSKVN